MKEATSTSDVQQIRDLESALAGIRTDRIKEEKAANAAKKGENCPQLGHTPSKEDAPFACTAFAKQRDETILFGV